MINGCDLVIYILLFILATAFISKESEDVAIRDETIRLLGTRNRFRHTLATLLKQHYSEKAVERVLKSMEEEGEIEPVQADSYPVLYRLTSKGFEEVKRRYY